MNYLSTTINLPLIKETAEDSPKMSHPTEVRKFCNDMSTMAQESFQVITLDTKNDVIDRHMITLGTVNASIVHPRDVFKVAITDNATSIIVIHNHPSGDPAPSFEDITVTKDLIYVGYRMGIPVLDHVIIGRKTEKHNELHSMKENGTCDFSKDAK